MSTFYVVRNENDAEEYREFCQQLERKSQRIWTRLEKRCQKGTENEAEELKARAEKGEIEAMIVLGAFYEHGVGVEKDTKRAGELYRKASFAIDGDFFRKSKDGSRPMWTGYELAEPLLKKAALFGDDFALGKCYDLGGCLGFDKERCRQHYQRAAEKGDAEAMFNLSRTYSMAWLSHSEPDPVLEKKYLVQAAERGHTFALILLINNSKDDAERVKWLELLAANCDGNFFEEFVYELAVRYEQGKGVSQDDHKAVKWYAKAAELGSAKSFLALARCHMSGRGVKQDEELASQLYVEAAKRNSAEAMYELALISESVDLKYEMAGWLGEAGRHGHLPSKLRYAECLEYGVGVTKDPAAAVAIYKELGSLKSDSFAFTTLEDSFSHTAGQFTEQSAEENMSICARAAYRVAMAYKNGKGVESDLAQTVKWLKKSAKLGSSEAMFTLGQYSERGEGMRKSPKIAVKWYEAAAKLDHQPAQERLKELVPKQI